MRKYEKPVFIAEKYEFSESIAACKYNVHDSDGRYQEPLLIKYGENVCAVGDNGQSHRAGSGLIGREQFTRGENSDTLVLFNDGAYEYDGTNGCDYDWDGSVVTGPSPSNTIIGTFAQAFHAAKAENENHAPGYKGQAFYS